MNALVFALGSLAGFVLGAVFAAYFAVVLVRVLCEANEEGEDELETIEEPPLEMEAVWHARGLCVPDCALCLAKRAGQGSC